MILQDDKVLITRSVGDELWDFPGGRIDPGEALEDAVQREVREELGVEFIPEGIVCTEQSLHRKDNAFILFATYKGRLADPSKPFTNPDNEAEETKWVDKKEIQSFRLFDQCLKPLKTLWNIV